MNPAISPGARLGRYEIKSQLGRGGMGEVYLARDTTELQRQVAIKVLPALFAADTEHVGRFIREAQTASSLNHPNILTIFEIGEANSSRFIVTEFIDGETLQQRLARTRIPIDDALDIAIQVATALTAAHKARVLHRDIKPANVMIRAEDGLVKLLDFGLAKATERPPMQSAPDSEDPTEVLFKTSPGVVLGTVAYMSPEQACGGDVDERADIWSLGCVLYQMVAGCTPFVAATSSELFGLILSKDKPPSLARYAQEVPDRLERIVARSLAKNRDERYQSASEMLIDLRQLKQNREAGRAAGHPQTGESQSASEETLIDHPISQEAKAASTQLVSTPATSSAEYLVSQILNHKRGVAIGLALLITTGLTLSYFFYFNKSRSPALTDQDTILIADFDNKTGDAVFDGTLKQGLAVQLEQSPFLSLFPNARVRQMLPLMGRSPEERVTAEMAREICQRQGLKALIAGTIAPLGSHYVITLEAIAGGNGDVLASEQAEAESKEQVLKSLSQAASNLREKLGESLGSIQKFDQPLDEATTSSLEALKAFSMATEQSNRGKYLEAISFNKRAVEIDPNFAYAYGALAAMYNNTNQPRLATENAAKAFQLRDRASELEKFRISNYYYTFVTGELDKAVEVLELYKTAYPRDHRPFNSLSDKYFRLGQFDKAAAAASEALKINPNNGVAYANLIQALFPLNRLTETKAACDRAVELKLDNAATHAFLYFLAVERKDAVAMQRELEWGKGKPEEYLTLWWQSSTAAMRGQMTRARDLADQLVELSTRNGLKEAAVTFESEAVARAAVIGDCAQAKRSLAQSRRPRESEGDGNTALASALCGEPARVQSFLTETLNRKSKDTMSNGLWVPVIRGAMELQRGNATQAMQFLEVGRQYESAGLFWPQYLRGQAYLKLGRSVEAATEFQKIIDHRTQSLLSPLYPLAHLGLARATAQTGDTARSARAYDDFFLLWKDADPDIPILLEARRERELQK